MSRKAVVLFLSTVTALTAVFILCSGIEPKSSRYGGGKDLVEEYYDQAVKQSDNLKAIENAIDRFYKNKEDALQKYTGYNYLNTRYYSDARATAARITDSSTRQRALDEISKSEAAYNNRLSAWRNEIARLNEREKELGNQHELLKILTTLPMISKYQDTDMPDMKKMQEANQQLQQVLEQIKALTK